MLDVTLVFLVIAIIIFVGMRSEASTDESECSLPKEVTPHNKFLVDLQRDVENTVSPPPSDATLSSHYYAMIKAEIDTRLSLMPSS